MPTPASDDRAGVQVPALDVDPPRGCLRRGRGRPLVSLLTRVADVPEDPLTADHICWDFAPVGCTVDRESYQYFAYQCLDALHVALLERDVFAGQLAIERQRAR